MNNTKIKIISLFYLKASSLSENYFLQFMNPNEDETPDLRVQRYLLFGFLSCHNPCSSIFVLSKCKF